MNGLEVCHLQKRFGDQTVVDDLNFRVDAGEVFGLIGPNGAGKSTSIMMIIGLLEADGGSIVIDGQRYDGHNPDMRMCFGVVPQELAIYPELTAVQNLRLFGRLNGLRGRRLNDRVDYVLEVTGLGCHAHQASKTYSGGMARRLNFGIALLHEPRFVVLDEPTVGIDPQSRARLLDAVRDLSRTGVGVLYASHYMEEVQAVCHRVAIIDHGRLLKVGTLDQLLDRTQMRLKVTVAAVSADIAMHLRVLADLRDAPDGTTDISIHERVNQDQVSGVSNLRLVLELLEAAKIPVLRFESQETSLETLFLNLTGKKLRD